MEWLEDGVEENLRSFSQGFPVKPGKKKSPLPAFGDSRGDGQYSGCLHLFLARNNFQHGQTKHQTPECAADPSQGKPRCGYEERNESRIPFPFILQRA